LLNENRSGSCLCGEILFILKGDMKWCSNCHCTRCQKGHGSGYVTWLGYEKNQITIHDKSEILKWYSSSKNSEFGCCYVCGSSVFYKSKKVPSEIHITLANLDNSKDIFPSSDNYFDSHAPWMMIDNTLPKRNDPNL
jgi:hypothetical protein